MHPIKTQDGSLTYYNKEYGDYYHSKSGAIEESMKKYVEPCRIRQKAGFVRVLDIGFGLGYNAIAAIGAARGAGGEIEVLSLEKDNSVIQLARDTACSLPYHHILKELEYDPLTESYLYEDKYVHLKIKMGDALDTLPKKGAFDAVFLDPFSPKRNPELWSVGFFRRVRSIMVEKGILATYSYAGSVRRALEEAGFTVQDGPIVGRRSPSTVAINLKR